MGQTVKFARARLARYGGRVTFIYTGTHTVRSGVGIVKVSR